jgi:hypothetical protein
MDTHRWLNTNLVRLHKAVLCANCEVISEGLNGHCAACGSEALLQLQQLLGCTAEPELNFQFTSPVEKQPSVDYFRAAA